MNRRRAARSTATPTPSPEAVRSKVLRIVCRHEQLKVSFDQLQLQIRAGLLEVQDVYEALATQLMQLVGLKTAEMAEDGRFSTVTTFETEDYMKKATKASSELMRRQKLQLIQLMTLLKNVEAQVNPSQNSILQDLANHRAFIKKLFSKASTFVSSVHQSGRSNDLVQMMPTILQATFDQVGAAFGSVEVGVEGLITELADKMCNPMVQYVHGLKAELQTGTSSCLMEVVKEMHGAIQVRSVELEQARYLTRLAEQRLMKSEETTQKLTLSLSLLTEDMAGHHEEKSIKMREDQAKDDSLMWELLRQKRKSLSDSSPLGPKELLGISTGSKRRVISRPPKRSLLGSSPSATTRMLCGKRVTP